MPSDAWSKLRDQIIEKAVVHGKSSSPAGVRPTTTSTCVG